MTPLDDAVAAHMAHPAGSGADPLTDSLCDQVTMPAQPPLSLRPGWEHEPIDVPMPLWLALAAFCLGCFAFAPSLAPPVLQRAASAPAASQAGSFR